MLLIKCIAAFIITISVLFIVSCNPITDDVSNNNKAFKNHDGVSQEQFEKDMNDSDKIKLCHRSDYVYESPYKVNKYEIVKRQTNSEQKEDTIYVKLDLRNDYFFTSANAQFNYEFYDVGGWILENISVSVDEVTPIREPEAECAMAFIIKDTESGGWYIEYVFENVQDYESVLFYDDDVYLSNPECVLLNGSEGISAQVQVQYETKYVQGNATAKMIFADNNWKIDSELTILDCTEKQENFFSSLNGTYREFNYYGYAENRTIEITVDNSLQSSLPICNVYESTDPFYSSFEGKMVSLEDYYTCYIDPLRLCIPYDFGDFLGAGYGKLWFDLDKGILTFNGWTKYRKID